MSPRDYILSEAVLPTHFETARDLFLEYAAQLGVDLSFQRFDSELEPEVMRGMYGPPSGCLLLIKKGDAPVGCGAIRRLDEWICEMKRLYVRSDERGAQLGRRATEYLIERARLLGYGAMRLDTLEAMTAARSLYRSLGFRDIAPYYSNPLPGTIYLELLLTR